MGHLHKKMLALELLRLAEGFGAPLTRCAIWARPIPAHVAIAAMLRRLAEGFGEVSLEHLRVAEGFGTREHLRQRKVALERFGL